MTTRNGSKIMVGSECLQTVLEVVCPFSLSSAGTLLGRHRSSM
ncbi:hypothetical protein [Sphingomonas sp. BK345]|nr:hypothetical protein [Sphingomonas sp. BK345]MBB3474285.1 hypothetical protein [Sphingomonas sp. BK345]